MSTLTIPIFPPQDRALLSRIDLICQAVLTGKWPSGPRGPEVCRGPGEGMARLPGDYGPPAPRVGPPDEAPMSYTRLRHSPEEKEFTVQIKDVSRGAGGAHVCGAGGREVPMMTRHANTDPQLGPQLGSGVGG